MVYQKKIFNEESMRDKHIENQIKQKAIELAEQELEKNGISNPMIRFNPAKDSHAAYYDLSRDYQTMHADLVLKHMKELAAQYKSEPNNSEKPDSSYKKPEKKDYQYKDYYN